MLAESEAFNGFGVDDPEAAREFYGDRLGLKVETLDPEVGLMELHVGGGRRILIYPKDDVVPGNYTMLNFPVSDIEAAVEWLSGRGVELERYEGTQSETDEDGIFRKGGPLIAWFTDPAGHTLSVIEQD